MPNVHGRGALPIGPQTFEPVEPAAPKKPTKSRAIATYEAAVKKDSLKAVPAAEAKALEAKFAKGGLKTENLAPGRAGASILGTVVKGELFARTKGSFRGAAPTWQSAGQLLDAPKPKPAPEAPAPGWGPRPKSLEARAQKTVAARMNMIGPEFQLKGAELAEVKRAIANGELQAVNATPKGLAGAGYTGYVGGDMLVVERRSGRPMNGAPPKSAFYLLGPLL